MSEQDIDIGGSHQEPVKRVPISSEQPKQEPNQAFDTSNNEALVDSIISNRGGFKYEIVELPSRGWYYDWDNGNVEVRPFGLDIEQILGNQRLAQSGQAINMVLKACCRFPDGFTSEQLLVGDQVFLLYYLRGITHGNNYEFLVECPECGASSTHNFDLNELIETMKQPIHTSEPFRVILPYLSSQVSRDFFVECRLLRVADVTRTNQLEKAKNKVNSKRTVQAGRQKIKQNSFQISKQDGLGTHLASSIVSVQGVHDRFKIEEFVQTLHSADIAAITEAIEEATPGIDPVITVTCPECDASFIAPLPITEEFFRPKKHRRLRT